MSDDDEPEVAFFLDLRGLSVTLSVAEDGEPTLKIADDQMAVAIETGAGGTYADAIQGAEALAERATMLVAILRTREGDRMPLTALPDELAWWAGVDRGPSVNTGGL